MKKKNLAVSIKQVCKKVVSLFNVVFCGFILSINSVYAEGSNTSSIDGFITSNKKNKVNKLNPIGTIIEWILDANDHIVVFVTEFQLHKLRIVPTKSLMSILKPNILKDI